MKIAIIGSGGVGGYFGAKLAQSGQDVTFLARGKHFARMKEEGLHIKSILGDFNVNPVKVTDKIQEMEPADLVLVTVKAWQIKEIRDELRTLVHPDTVLIPLQNGIMAADELAEVLDPHTILGGLCRIMSRIETPGVINHFGITPTIIFGERDKTLSERVNRIQSVFEKASIESHISADIEADLWKKFIAICMSGLLAVTRSTYGELRERKETRQLMIDLLTEIYNLSQKAGLRIKPDYVAKTMAAVDSFPYDSTASLTRDVWEGRPSEIEYQNGTVLRLAEKYGVDVPVNRFVYTCILPSELKARK
jgi:2-dehydropantoate 2-reductase